MIFKEPKVEFVAIEDIDVTTASGGGAGEQICASGSISDDFECYAPAYTD